MAGIHRLCWGVLHNRELKDISKRRTPYLYWWALGVMLGADRPPRRVGLRTPVILMASQVLPPAVSERC